VLNGIFTMDGLITDIEGSNPSEGLFCYCKVRRFEPYMHGANMTASASSQHSNGYFNNQRLLYIEPTLSFKNYVLCNKRERQRTITLH
jgi:hypothetical protein